MRTLKQILASDPQERTATEKAIQAAFWAGESHMRGKICIGLRDRIITRKTGRYHRVENESIRQILLIPEINQSFVFRAEGDSGIQESQELFDWDFDI